MEWKFELGEYDCEIGEVNKSHDGKWYGLTYISGRMTDRYEEPEPAMKAVEQAYRRDLEAKAALIGCKLVDDDTLKKLFRTAHLYNCIMNDKSPLPDEEDAKIITIGGKSLAETMRELFGDDEKEQG